MIEDERLPLAMEVSTKCGLDTSGVWAAWGMACLQCADYAGAREKFNRCLKVSLTVNLSVARPGHEIVFKMLLTKFCSVDQSAGYMSWKMDINII